MPHPHYDLGIVNHCCFRSFLQSIYTSKHQTKLESRHWLPEGIEPSTSRSSLLHSSMSLVRRTIPNGPRERTVEFLRLVNYAINVYLSSVRLDRNVINVDAINLNLRRVFIGGSHVQILRAAEWV